MARVVTYHPTLKQLVYSPAPEYDKLHGASLAKLGPTPLKAKTPLSLGDWPAGAGNASDITVSFSRPTTGAHDGLSASCLARLRLTTPCRFASACTLGLSVLSGSMTVFIDWPASPSDKVQVGIMDGTPSFAPAPPVGTIANGNCAPTNFGGDCNSEPSGAWNAAAEKITSLEECVAKAKECKMANFVSFSNVPGNADCTSLLSCVSSHRRSFE